LTHEDANTNINLATASTNLTTEMKKDSAAMKTIAIMTMAFLPSTFFAALFSIPSLKWDEPRVIQDNFWIYWAFALPSTIMVFLVWGLANSSWIHKIMVGAVKGKPKGTSDIEKIQI
jgi:hypothetical protein